MTTRAKAKLNNLILDTDAKQKSIIKKYESTIDKLKTDIIKKDALISTMTEEQKSNLIEFESICLENINIKKKIAENEYSNISLKDTISILEESVRDITKERDEFENELYKGIIPLQKELRTITEHYNALQIKHSNLQIKTAETLITKKKKRKHNSSALQKGRKIKALMKKIIKINMKCVRITTKLEDLKLKNSKNIQNENYYKIEREITKQIIESLTEQNKLFLSELTQRNDRIEYLQRENDNILKLIHEMEIDINKKVDTLDTIDFIEKQITEIKRRIDINDYDMDINYTDCNNEEQTIANSKLTSQKPTEVERLSSSNDTIFVFSDRYGLGFGDKLTTLSSPGNKVLNFCSPGTSLTKLVKKLSNFADEQSSKAAFVLLAGETVNETPEEFNDCIYILNRISKRNKVLLCTLPYRSQAPHSYEYNDYIYKLNVSAYNMTCSNNNIHLIDVNKIFNSYKYDSKVKNTLCKLILLKIDEPISKLATVMEITPKLTSGSVNTNDINVTVQTANNCTPFLDQTTLTPRVT